MDDDTLERIVQREVDSLAGDLEPGTRLGPYVVLDCIGHGGMGRVFLGKDTRLGRRVALKCLLVTPTGDVRHEQILHEARAAARVSHPNIATVHDVIEQHGRAFIVMEYVEGEALAARLKRERLTTGQIVAIGRQLASALAAAHARGVVHRDLKPGNIQIAPDGTVKILDFGIANAVRTLSTLPSDATTASGAPTLLRHAGTPPYMSPEQLLGHDVDERSDLYSLGVVLFEMATGRRPFTQTDTTALLAAQAHAAPRADRVDRRVPAALADVIAHALAIDPANRYQTALEIGAALDAVTAPAAVAERRGLRAPVRRILIGAAGTGGAVAAVGAVGFITTVGFNNTFGRTGEFSRFGVESWTAHFEWGLRAIFPTLFVMTLVAVATLAARLLLGVLELVDPLGRRIRRVRDACLAAAGKMGLDRPPALAQALAGLGIVSLGLIAWRYADLIAAWTSLFNSSPIERLLPMGPQNYGRHYYVIALDALILGFGYGLAVVLRMRRAMGVREGRASVALLIGVILVLLLMSQWPYRIMNWRDFERVDLAGLRCYVTGQTASEFLVLCPGATPPRNRAVRRDDPGLTRQGIVENVFEGTKP